MNRFDKQMLGEAGVHYLTQSGNQNLDFVGWKITVLSPTTFDFINNALSSGDTLEGIELPAGTELYGKFVNPSIFSGAIAIYKSEKL
jgi:hypothetical protein